MQLNEKLSMLRKNNNYSTRELADKVGVSQSSISLWEKGDRKPDFDKIVMLANIYGVSTDFLLGTRTQGAKSKLNELLEQRTLITSRISTTHLHLEQLSSDINICQKELIENQAYKNKITPKSDRNDLDSKIYTLIDQKIQSLDKQLQEYKMMKSHYYEDLAMLNHRLNLLEQQCVEEEKIVNHITNNFSLIDSKNFKDINILSEYELQIIILKYLDLYYIFEQSNLDINDFISKLKSHVHGNFWSY